MKPIHIYFALGLLLITATLYPGDEDLPSNALNKADKPDKTIVSKENRTDIPLTISTGYSISYFAKDIPGARAMIFDGSGNLLVSQTKAGKLVKLADIDKDKISDSVKVIDRGLNSPHGLLVMRIDDKLKLFVAETDKVISYDYDISKGTVANKKTLVSLPSGGGHFTRTLQKLDDGRILISVGSSCNACLEKDNRRAAILVMNTDGSRLRSYATGLRNSVFMTIKPGTSEIWATEMGRDNLGDDIPPDEVNVIKPNTDYGWPYCYGNKIQDIRFDKSDKAKRICAASSASMIDLQAHSAPLGLVFAPKAWSEKTNLLIAYHGSWNRSVPIGYKIVSYEQDSKGGLVQNDFITGWASGGNVYGRPVGLVFDDKGNLYISDDMRGVIYIVKQL